MYLGLVQIGLVSFESPVASGDAEVPGTESRHAPIFRQVELREALVPLHPPRKRDGTFIASAQSIFTITQHI